MKETIVDILKKGLVGKKIKVEKTSSLTDDITKPNYWWNSSNDEFETSFHNGEHVIVEILDVIGSWDDWSGDTIKIVIGDGSNISQLDINTNIELTFVE